MYVFEGSLMAVTVCDEQGIIVAMNEVAAELFQAHGGHALVGTSLYDCHSPASRAIIQDLIARGRTNVYTVEKNGAHRLIYQGPWKRGVERGILEVSFPVPPNPPHRVRDEVPAQPTLETARLVLEPLDIGEAGRVAELANDARVAATTQLPHPYRSDMARHFIAGAQLSWIKRTDAVFGIHLKSESDVPLIGVTGLHGDPFERSIAEGGYWLGVDYHGRGYATEAFAALVEWGLADFGLRRVSARSFVGNSASERVLEKTGFTYEGTSRQARTQMGVCYDVKLWGRLRDG